MIYDFNFVQLKNRRKKWIAWLYVVCGCQMNTVWTTSKTSILHLPDKKCISDNDKNRDWLEKKEAKKRRKYFQREKLREIETHTHMVNVGKKYTPRTIVSLSHAMTKTFPSLPKSIIFIKNSKNRPTILWTGISCINKKNECNFPCK